MGLFKKDNISIARQDPNAIAAQGGAAASALAPTINKLFQGGAAAAGQAAGTAARSALQLGTEMSPEIRAAQRAANPELFQQMESQEALASGDLSQRLQQMASDRLGKGLTFDEERASREASRGAFTSRGNFRGHAAVEDEIVRRMQGDRQAQMQNAAFAQNALGFQSGLNQQGIQNRQGLFLDPRTAAGVSAGQILGLGGQLGSQALGAGVGISQGAAAANQQAQAAEASANRGGGMFGKVLKGIAGVAAPALGGAFGNFLGGLGSGGGGGGSSFGGGFSSPSSVGFGAGQASGQQVGQSLFNFQ